MREIKFRGKHIASGKWLFGDLVQWLSKGKAALLPQEGDEWDNPYEFEVGPDTVGQFTGLQYRGVDVYEGMKFKFTYKDRERDENDEWKTFDVDVISTVEIVRGSWCVTEDGHDYKETMPCTLRQWIEDDDSELLGYENAGL